MDTDDDTTIQAPALWVAVMAKILARIMNHRMALMIEYQKREIAILRQRLDEPIRFDDRERRSLAEIAAQIGRHYLRELGTLVTPDTLMRWYRRLCIQKWVQPQKTAGRPRTKQEVRDQVVAIAQQWSKAGYTRIHDIMRELGYSISRSTVVNILKEAGIPTVPNRGMSWKQFVSTVMDGLCACDMFTVDTPSNTYYCLFAIKIATREIEIVNVTEYPDGEWMAQQGRNLCDCFDGFLRDAKYLIHDREPAFRHCLDPVLRNCGVKPVITPPNSPNLNAFAERFVRSIREECLDRIPIFGERHLRQVLREYSVWYNHERPHQGIDGKYIAKLEAYREDGRVVIRSRLGGLLPHFYRDAA